MPNGEWVVLVEECGCCKQPYWAYLCYMSPDCPGCDTIPEHFTVTITDGDGNTTDIQFSRYNETPSVDVPCADSRCGTPMYFEGFVRLKKNITIVGTELHDWCSSAHASLSFSDTGSLVGSITVDGDGCATQDCAVLVPDEPCTGAFFGDITSWQVMPAFPKGCSPSNPEQYPLSLDWYGSAQWYDCCQAQGATFIAPNGDTFDTGTQYYGCWALIDPEITITVRFSCTLYGECLDMISSVYVDTPFPNCDGYATISQGGGSTLLTYECEFTIAEWIAAGSPSGGWDCSDMTVSGGTIEFMGNGDVSLLTVSIVFRKIGNYPPVYEAGCEKGLEFPAHEWTAKVVVDDHEMEECFPGDGIHAFDEVGVYVDMVVKDYYIPVGDSESRCIMDADAANITATGFGGNLQLRYDYEIVRIDVDNKSYEVTIYVAAKCNGQGKNKLNISVAHKDGGGQLPSEPLFAIEAYAGEPIASPDMSGYAGFIGWTTDLDCVVGTVPACWEPSFPYANMPDADGLTVYAVFDNVYWLYCYWPAPCARLANAYPYHEGDAISLPGMPSLYCKPSCTVPGGWTNLTNPGQPIPNTMPASDVEIEYAWLTDTNTYTITLHAGWGKFCDGDTVKTFSGHCGDNVPSFDPPWLGRQAGGCNQYGPNRFIGWFDENDQAATVPSKFGQQNLSFYAKYRPLSIVLSDASSYTAGVPFTTGTTLSGTLPSNIYGIEIAPGAEITLAGVTIPGRSGGNASAPGITLGCDAIINLSGTNVVRRYQPNSDDKYPAIYVPEGCTLTIRGSGSLTANGIGGGYSLNGGNIVIEGGTITAEYFWLGASIGGGQHATFGNITITGGTIMAAGGIQSAGIGSGYGNGSTCGNITITGGSVTAVGGRSSAGIGGGYYQTICGDITIADTVTVVSAEKGDYAPYSIGSGQQGTCGTVTIGGIVGEISTSPYIYQP